MGVRPPYPIDNLTIGAGAQSEQFTVPGNRVTVTAATAGSSLLVSIDNGPYIPVAPGLQITLQDVDGEFRTLRFKNGGGTSLTFTAVVGWADYRDTRFTSAGTVSVVISGTPDVKPVIPSAVTPAASTSLATANNLDIAANANRRLLSIYNDHASATVWFRDQGGTTLIGQPIGPKQTLSVEFSGACRVRNASGSTVDLYVTEWTA